MGQESRWPAVVYPLKDSNRQLTARKKQMAGSKWTKSQDGQLLFTPLKSQPNIEQQQRHQWQGQNGPRVKIRYCCLPPERVSLTMNSKKGTNGRVKMGQGSNWAKSQNGQVKMGYCCLTPERFKLTVNSEQQQETNGRVKIDQESR